MSKTKVDMRPWDPPAFDLSPSGEMSKRIHGVVDMGGNFTAPSAQPAVRESDAITSDKPRVMRYRLTYLCGGDVRSITFSSTDAPWQAFQSIQLQGMAITPNLRVFPGACELLELLEDEEND